MSFTMPLIVVGAMSFKPDGGDRINQIFVLNNDPTSDLYKGYVPAKMSCEKEVVDSLNKAADGYPISVDMSVLNKTAGGKTTQHALQIVKAGK